MTDTRKDFEDWYAGGFSPKPDFTMISKNHYKDDDVDTAYWSWQACQSLNDKRIQQLLAVIELQRQAINQAINDMAVSVGMVMLDGGMPTKEQTQKVIDISKPDSDIGKLKQALAIKPEDVELVEVGYVKEEKIADWMPSAELSVEYNYDGFNAGDKLYTIKTKE